MWQKNWMASLWFWFWTFFQTALWTTTSLYCFVVPILTPFFEANLMWFKGRHKMLLCGFWGGTTTISVTFLVENFVHKRVVRGGGGTPLADKIRKVVFDVLPKYNECLHSWLQRFQDNIMPAKYFQWEWPNFTEIKWAHFVRINHELELNQTIMWLAVRLSALQLVWMRGFLWLLRICRIRLRPVLIPA